MTTFPGSPRLSKGALIGLDPMNPVASVIVFQYNPHTLTRTILPRLGGGSAQDGGRAEALRLQGPPEETIRVEIELDAAEGLERGDATAAQMGIAPQLSALEMLVYPKSALVIANTVLLAAGTIEVIPPMAPLTVFVWGRRRVLPVRPQELTITEEAHDNRLNPIRAKVTLGLQVLTYHDLPVGHPGYALFLSHQVVKETMATIAGTGRVPNG
jgi:hypothetical protein